MDSGIVFQELRGIFGEAAQGGYPPGTIRSWKGRGDFKKMKNGEWVPVKAKGGGKKGPEKKLKRKAPAGGGGGGAPKPKAAAAAAPPKKLKKKAPAAGGGGGGAAPPSGGGGGGPEKTAVGRVGAKPSKGPAKGKAKGGGGGAAAPKKGPDMGPAQPGDFDDPDHEKNMRGMFRSLSKDAQDKILAKLSPKDREMLTKPEPEPIKLTNPVPGKPAGGVDKTAAGRGQKPGEKPGPPVATDPGASLPKTAISPPERGGPKPKQSPADQAAEKEGETVAGELKKALGHSWKALKIPFKRMSDHLKKPETREKIKGTFKAAVKTAAKAAKSAGKAAAFVGKTYAKHMTPDLFKFASKLAKGHEYTREERDKAIDNMTKVAKDLIASAGFFAATGGQPFMFPQKNEFKQVVHNSLDKPIRKAMEFAFEKVEQKAKKKQTSAVEELRSVLFAAKEDELDPSDLEELFAAFLEAFSKEDDISDADIGMAFKSSGATTDMAKSWAGTQAA